MQNIETLVKNLILEEKRYLPAKEVASKLNLSLFTLYKYLPDGIEFLCTEVGYPKPKLHSKDSLETTIKEYIRTKNSAVSAFEIANTLNISRATLKKYGVDVYSLNEQEGFSKIKILPALAGSNKGFKKENRKEYQYKKDIPPSEVLIEECLSIIEAHGHYCSANYLSQKLSISTNTFGYRNIDISKLNASLGFIRNNRCFENLLKHILEDLFSNVVTQKWFKDCKSDLGKYLYFDFFIPELNLAIEADGPCHNDPGHPWYTEKVLRRDYLKNEYCKLKKIILVRIPYLNVITKEIVLDYLSRTPLEIELLQRKEKS